LLVTSWESLLGCHMSDATDMQGTRAGLPHGAFRAEPMPDDVLAWASLKGFFLGSLSPA